MITTQNMRDPVQGLIDYSHDIKPYHSKIIEIWVEYVHSDTAQASVDDDLQMIVNIALDRRFGYCQYGFDTQPWNEQIIGIEIDELIPGIIRFQRPGQPLESRPRHEVLGIYFEYTREKWRFLNGLAPNPGNPREEILTPLDRFYVLSFSNVWDYCMSYFVNVANNAEYWYDPSRKTIYVLNKNNGGGNRWEEATAGFVGKVPPPYPLEADLWFDTFKDKLYQYIGTEWAEILKVHITYNTPKVAPEYPVEWLSNWDSQVCLPPFGETTAHAYVEDKLEFTHGSEIFFFDSIRAVMFDRQSKNSTIYAIGDKDLEVEHPPIDTQYTQRTEYPIKYKTEIKPDANGRYQVTRREISIATPKQPGDPDYEEYQEIISNPWTIHLDGDEFGGLGMEFGGTGLHRYKRGVRLTDFHVWQDDGQGGQAQLSTIPVINNVTFGFKEDNGKLVLQTIDPLARARQAIDVGTRLGTHDTNLNRNTEYKFTVELEGQNDKEITIRTPATGSGTGGIITYHDLVALLNDSSTDFTAVLLTKAQAAEFGRLVLTRTNVSSGARIRIIDKGESNFLFRQLNGFSHIESPTLPGRTNIATNHENFPFTNNQIIYFTAVGDLPKYNLITQEHRKPTSLLRYQPYRLVIKDVTGFSVSILKMKDVNDPTPDQLVPDNNISIYETDTDLMGAETSLTFVDGGHGELFTGIGYPIVFAEQQAELTETEEATTLTAEQVESTGHGSGANTTASASVTETINFFEF